MKSYFFISYETRTLKSSILYETDKTDLGDIFDSASQFIKDTHSVKEVFISNFYRVT